MDYAHGGIARNLSRIGLVFLTLFGSALFANDQAPSLQEFAAASAIQAPNLSTAGTHFSFVRQSDDIDVLVIANLNNNDAPWTIYDKDWFIAWHDWLSDHEVLVGFRQPYALGQVLETTQTRLIYANTLTREVRQILKHDKNAVFRLRHASVVFSAANSADRILVSGRVSRFGSSSEVFEVSAKRKILPTQSMSLPRKNMLSWLADANGQVRVGYGRVPNKPEEILMLFDGNGQWRDLRALRNQKNLKVLALSTKDKDAVDVSWLDDDGARQFGELLVSERSLTLSENVPKDSDVFYAARTSDGKEISRIWFEDGSVIYREKLLADSHRDISQQFPNKRVLFSAISRDRSRLIVSVSDVNTPPMFYLYDTSQKELSVIQSDRPSLYHKIFAKTEFMHVVSSDGVKVPVDVTLPVGFDLSSGMKLPFVVIPADGVNEYFDTFAYQRESFDEFVELLVAHGIGVLKVYQRGTRGFGVEYENLGLERDQPRVLKDVQESLDHLIDSGWADDQRICVLGASFGANLALRLQMEFPERYRCVVSINGVNNLDRFVQDRANKYYLGARLAKRLGYDWNGDAFLKASSAYYSSDDLTAPALIVHLKQSAWVDVSQSRKFSRKHRSKTLRYVELDGADDRFSRSSDRELLFGEVLHFLEENLK